ncbi:MAG: cell division ATP-binding protein FtsE [Candidatus Desulforudis sp.]|nr:cell division ATP-binding protein FtsE [Desulforudis sp.]
MIQLYNVSKVYDSGIPAVSDISIRIAKGEFVFLVGPSGAGKSTVTRLIFREQLPTTGQVFFRGKNVLRFGQRDILQLRRQIGMVFQDFRLLPRKTVFENVAFALEVIGRSRREIRERVPVALAQVGLQGKEEAFPDQLSGGEQQRVGVARAIVKKPLVILADEPTGNLDPDTSWELMGLFEQINRDGTTVLIATHAWDIVNRMRKRVIALENGRLVRDEEQGSYRHGA